MRWRPGTSTVPDEAWGKVAGYMRRVRMKALDDVMEALRQCSDKAEDYCSDKCPYWDIGTCDTEMMRDAMAYLGKLDTHYKAHPFLASEEHIRKGARFLLGGKGWTIVSIQDGVCKLLEESTGNVYTYGVEVVARIPGIEWDEEGRL